MAARRSTALTALGALVFLLPGAGCNLLVKERKTDFEALDLIPEPVDVVMALQPAAMVDSPLEPLLEQMVKDVEGEHIVEAFTKCDVGPANMKRVTAALRGDDDGVVMVEAPGVGSEKTWTCIHDAYESITGTDPWNTRYKGGERYYELTEVDTDAFVVNDDLVAFADGALSDGVVDLLHGRGESARDKSLVPLLAKVETEHQLWFALVASAPVKAELDGIPGAAGSQYLAGDIDLDGAGMSGHLTLVMADEATAKASREELEGFVELLAAGLELADGDRLELSARGADLQLSFAVPALKLLEVIAAGQEG